MIGRLTAASALTAREADARVVLIGRRQQVRRCELMHGRGRTEQPQSVQLVDVMEEEGAAAAR